MENRDQEFVKFTMEEFSKMGNTVLRTILREFVEDYPNDMELGAAIRKYFYELSNK